MSDDERVPIEQSWHREDIAYSGGVVVGALAAAAAMLIGAPPIVACGVPVFAGVVGLAGAALRSRRDSRRARAALSEQPEKEA